MTKEKKEAPEIAEAPKRKKKLTKVIDGTVLTITESVTEEVMTFDFSDLPANIQALFGPFGMASKLGDAAAGKKGADVVAAIKKVWDGLMEGNWTVRAPKAEKISKSSIMDNYNSMPEGPEKVATYAALKNLGIIKD